MDKIILNKMHFIGRHGVLPLEKRRKQPFEATVELDYPLTQAGRSDALEDTLDYREVQAIVRDVIEGSHKQLIETLAEGVADALLARFPHVPAVTVEIVKLRPPVDFQFAGVSVRIRRERRAAKA
ncbi:MAG: dihydroneopterin aldolase [Opitutales bacterium]